mmetsp:Transcript_5412/g.15666  ORF Transcript_5412/g.15666 Transcript_5412/m.15666 type:complete len:247 (-) Transcript_5412:438-1178(-)
MVDVVLVLQDDLQRVQVADVDDGVAAEAVAPTVDGEPGVRAHLLRELLQEEPDRLCLAPDAAADPGLGAQALADVCGLGGVRHDRTYVPAVAPRAGEVQGIEAAGGLLAAGVRIVPHEQLQHGRVVAQGAHALQDGAATHVQAQAMLRGCEGSVYVCPSLQELEDEVLAPEVGREPQGSPAAAGHGLVPGPELHLRHPLVQRLRVSATRSTGPRALQQSAPRRPQHRGAVRRLSRGLVRAGPETLQ